MDHIRCFDVKAVRVSALVAEEFVAFANEGYPLGGEDDAGPEFLDATEISGIVGSAVLSRPSQDSIAQAEIIVNADVVDALIGTGPEHAIEKVAERLVGLVAEADATSAAGLNFAKSVPLIKHISAGSAPVEIAPANGVAVGRVEHSHMVGADEGHSPLADLVALVRSPLSAPLTVPSPAA